MSKNASSATTQAATVAAAQAAMSAAVIAGQATQASATVAAAAVQKAAQASSITGDAAVAAANTYAAVSAIPLIGPVLAPPAAALAYAAVLAFESFEAGGIVSGGPGMPVPIMALPTAFRGAIGSINSPSCASLGESREGSNFARF